MIYPEMLAAKDINNGLKMSWVRQRWDVHNGALVMLGIKLRETCEILNKPLKDISGPDDPYHVVAIKRGADTIIPGGNDILKLYDMAYFMTTRQYIPYIRKIVGKEHYVDVKNVMVMGGGRTAVRAVKTMPEYMDVKIIEKDDQRCERLNEHVTYHYLSKKASATLRLSLLSQAMPRQIFLHASQPNDLELEKL